MIKDTNNEMSKTITKLNKAVIIDSCNEDKNDL